MFSGKAFCVVTGASRGIGKCLATELALRLDQNSVLLLLSRDLEKLNTVKREIQEKSPAVKVFVESVDFSKPSKIQYDEILQRCLQGEQNFTSAAIFHNAATIGYISKPLSEYCNADDLSEYFTTNVTSPLILNNCFLRSLASASDLFVNRFIVNVSSTAAFSSKNSMHLYGAAKAARDALFRGLAMEDESLRVLTLSPGPVVTDMQMELYKDSYDPGVKEWSQSGVDQKTFLTALVAAQKILTILDENQFKSGVFTDIRGFEVSWVRNSTSNSST